MTREEAIAVLAKIQKLLAIYPKRKKQKESVNEIDTAIGMAIEALQTEVVRCKDCKHRETDECPMYWMEWLIIDEGDGYTDNDFIIHDYTTDDGHCNFGERKGGDDE